VVHVRGTGRPERGAGAILRALRQRRYEVGPSYTPLHELPAYARFARRRLDGADATWRDLIELPCEPGVPLAAVDAIAATVARALA
jgi:hypothetical protein